MNLSDVIGEYRRAKQIYAPISDSLEEKLRNVDRVLGKLDANTGGTEIAEAAVAGWDGCQANTVSRYLRQLRAVRKWAVANNLIASASPIPLPYVNDVKDVEITSDQLDLLLDHVRMVESWAYPSILFLAHTGARLNEAMLCSEASFTSSGVLIKKPVDHRTKTIDRLVPYTQRMRREVNAGLHRRLFLRASDGRRISSPKVASATLGKVLYDSATALGIPRISAHDLRHAFAALVAEHGADLADIASLLGHSSTQMSMRYRGLVKNKVSALLAGIQ